MSIFKQTLECRLTKEEIYDRSKELAHANSEVSAFKDRLKSLSSDFKARIDEKAARIGVLSGEISRESTYREVECEIHFNLPSDGEKTIIRKDTGEIYRIDIMSIAEKENLFINTPKTIKENKKTDVSVVLPSEKEKKEEQTDVKEDKKEHSKKQA